MSAPVTDPKAIADRLSEEDPYLISYLLGWGGYAKPEPWGAAASFALEMAHGYGLIVGESDPTLTELGQQVAHLLSQEGQP
jgi:hypothetical protein